MDLGSFKGEAFGYFKDTGNIRSWYEDYDIHVEAWKNLGNGEMKGFSVTMDNCNYL